MDESMFEAGNVFEDGEVLSEEYTPTELPEREDEMNAIGRGLRRIFRGETPKNMFLVGKTGQGKTVTARRVLSLLETHAVDSEISVASLFVPCRNFSSSYRVACHIVERHTGENPNGHSQQKVFEKMYSVLESLADNIVLVLDEIDSIGQNHDILYDIPRARDNGAIEDTKIGMVGITNDREFLRNLDPQAKSSLYEKEIQFDVYDAADLRAILTRRVDKAFKDNVVTDGAVAKCAAHAAQDEGSARQAIEYMYEAGDLADYEADSNVTEAHIERAIEEVHLQEITQSISGLTLQDQIALISVVTLESLGDTPSRTRRVYTEYSEYTKNFAAVNTLSFDRTREHLKELELIGILSKTVRTGDERGGKKYYWELNVDLGATIDVLQSIEDSRISDCLDFVANAGNSTGLSRGS